MGILSKIMLAPTAMSNPMIIPSASFGGFSFDFLDMLDLRRNNY